MIQGSLANGDAVMPELTLSSFPATLGFGGTVRELLFQSHFLFKYLFLLTE